jgi:mono/diheme cytochrome c family protein
MNTPTDPAPDAKEPAAGGDSVQAMHEGVMHEMNEPTMALNPGSPDAVVPPHPGVSPGGVLMREHSEPRDGFEPVPFWVMVTFGLLLMWGGMYLGAYSGPMTDTLSVGYTRNGEWVSLFEIPFFDSKTFDRSNLRPGREGGGGGPVVEPNPQTVDELSKEGAKVYANVCQACHQPNGQGNPAQGIPPLSGSEWVAGDQASAARLSRILLYGLNGPITVKGRPFNGQMPAQGGALKDWQIAAAITFVRNSWDNKGDPDNAKPLVSVAAVKAARAKEKGRSTAGTAATSEAELKGIPVAKSDLGDAAKDEKKDPALKGS